MWQWKDDSTRIVPKLSYVKAFEPWNWIVGTGIYLEDVRIEISQLRKRLLRIALWMSFILGTILAFIIRQSLGIERKQSKCRKRTTAQQGKIPDPGSGFHRRNPYDRGSKFCLLESQVQQAIGI